MDFHQDVWASGQMGSKLWLCHELEKIKFNRPQGIWVLGGWCGLMAQLLLSREKMPISTVRSFDIDASCEARADSLNNLWVWQGWRFKAFTFDCNNLNYNECAQWASLAPDIVINTATEHFESLKWWQAVPAGTLCALQSNNMSHADHIFKMTSAEEMSQTYKMQKIFFMGCLGFDYQNPTSFERYMLVGVK